MRVTPIAIGDPPLLNAAGLHAPWALRTIVELVSDDRITGVGEIPGGSATLAMLRDAREVVVGHDPFQLNGIKQALVERFGDGGVSALKDVRPWETARIKPRLERDRSGLLRPDGQGHRAAGGRSARRRGA